MCHWRHCYVRLCLHLLGMVCRGITCSSACWQRPSTTRQTIFGCLPVPRVPERYSWTRAGQYKGQHVPFLVLAELVDFLALQLSSTELISNNDMLRHVFPANTGGTHVQSQQAHLKAEAQATASRKPLSRLGECPPDVSGHVARNVHLNCCIQKVSSCHGRLSRQIGGEVHMSQLHCHRVLAYACHSREPLPCNQEPVALSYNAGSHHYTSYDPNNRQITGVVCTEWTELEASQRAGQPHCDNFWPCNAPESVSMPVHPMPIERVHMG